MKNNAFRIFAFLVMACVAVLPGKSGHAMPLGIRMMMQARAAVRQAASESARQTWLVTFNANGGTGSMAPQPFTEGVAQSLAPNAFVRLGYTFAGWAERADGDVVYADGQRVTFSSARTLYARWKGIFSEGEVIAGRLDMDFAKAQTAKGVLTDKNGRLVGTVQVKAGKVNRRRGTVKLSVSVTLLVDGKAKKVTARAVLAQVGSSHAQTPLRSMRLAFRAPIGEMAFELAADGTFTLKNASYAMGKKMVGGALKGGARGTFRLSGFDLSVPGELQEDLLPYEVPFDVAGGKWRFAKSTRVKWAKDKKTNEFGRVVDESGGKTNHASLKLTYTSKTGVFKGSFKVYALDEANGRKKLKKYTVKVLGLVVDGVGQGEASCKQPAAGAWPVAVE